tara:strand:- start:31790 stop:31960 length:171 start_codon:yes stop_codon:yes gene_type:complete
MSDKKAKNNTVTITVGSPLLRPGLTISTDVSMGYAETAAEQMLGLARAINAPQRQR